jgi:3-oxoacyl-[acyl-carrier protein] reductase
MAAQRSLDGVPALVTGASRGIGAATARRLAEAGACVAVVYRSGAQEAEKVVAGIEDAGGRAFAVACDIASPDDVDRMVGAVEAELGPVGVLVNNAGIHRGGRIQNLSVDDWNAVIATDLTGAFLCSRRVVPGMIERRYGRIVNVSSVVGINGFPGDSAYAAAKAGLLGLTRALALELAPHGVTVNALAPGFVDTEMTQRLSEKARTRTNEAIPLGRQADSDEIAEAIAFLVAGPGYVTGSTVTVDGGWTLA